MAGLARRWGWFLGLLGAFLVGTLMPGEFPWLPVGASPLDVKGSDNVAVCSYATRQGHYVLWAGGRITKAPGGEAVTSTYGAPPTGYAAATRSGNAPVGAPAVAVGIVPLDDGTYVLFSDGSIKKPSDPGASAPPPLAGMESVWGLVGSDGTVRGGSGDFQAASGGTGPTGFTFTITFDRPFKQAPTVVAMAASSANMGLDVRAVATASGATIYMTNTTGSPPHTPNDFAFLAVGR